MTLPQHSVEALCSIPLSLASWKGTHRELIDLALPPIDDVPALAADIRAFLVSRPELIEAWELFSADTRTDRAPYFVGHTVGELGYRYPRVVIHGNAVDSCVDYIFWRILPDVPWGSPRFEPTVQFRAQIVGWHSDDPQPGLVEASIVDVSGSDHRVIAKHVYLTDDVYPGSDYPFEEWVEAEVVSEEEKSVRVKLPWGMETLDGEEQLSLDRADVRALE